MRNIVFINSYLTLENIEDKGVVIAKWSDACMNILDEAYHANSHRVFDYIDYWEITQLILDFSDCGFYYNAGNYYTDLKKIVKTYTWSSMSKVGIVTPYNLFAEIALEGFAILSKSEGVHIQLFRDTRKAFKWIQNDSVHSTL